MSGMSSKYKNVLDGFIFNKDPLHQIQLNGAAPGIMMIIRKIRKLRNVQGCSRWISLHIDILLLDVTNCGWG